MSCKFNLKVLKINVMKPQKVLLSGTEIKKLHTLKPCYNEPQYSEFRDIVNKT